MRVANPYNYNLPVGTEMFFGRQEDLETLAYHLTAAPGDSFALIGGRRMGKTSLLKALSRALEEMRQEPTRNTLSLYIFLDLTGEGVDSVAAFFHTICDRAYALLADRLELPPRDVVPIDEQQPPAPAFARVLEDWERAVITQQGCRLRLILLLDECERIAEQPWAPELYGALRYLLVGEATLLLLKVVMAGSHRFLTQVHQEGSPLQNVLKYHRLRVLDDQATRDLITQPTGDILPEEVAQTVVRQSGGHPFLTQYLMHYLWEHGFEHATSESVDRIAAGFPYERNDFWKWAEGLGDSGLWVYKVLVQAEGALTENQVRFALHPVPPDLLQALDALCYHGLVVRGEDGKSYQVAGSMFQDWFEANIAERLESGLPEQPEPRPTIAQPAPPGVSVSLITPVVPTAYCYHLDATAFPLVTVTLDNTGQGCANAMLRVSVTVEGYSDTAVAGPEVSHGKQAHIPLLPMLKPSAVATLNEIRPATLRVTVEQTTPPVRTLYDQTERIHLHARDTALLAVKSPDGSIVDLTEYLAAWITPHRPEIEKLLRKAADHHPDRQFVGYQGASTLAQGAEIVRAQGRAIFTVLKQDANLVYINSPLSLGTQEGQITQRVRLPTESLTAGSSANCIDGTVLFASLLELAAIDPFIVIVPGHAFVGWRSWQGVDSYEFLETTMIGSDDFDAAQQIGKAQYETALLDGYFSRGLFDPGGFARLIDVTACRAKGIYPLE